MPLPFLSILSTVTEGSVALPWMFCDVRIRGVEGLFDGQVEVNGEVRHSELGKASEICFAKGEG